MEGKKSLVTVDMVVQNRVTRVTYRVTSTSPIGIILPKVNLIHNGEKEVDVFGAKHNFL